MQKLISVYGTLRNRIPGDFVGYGILTGGRLVFPGHTIFPAWVEDGCDKRTVAEIYHVDELTIQRLDVIEGISDGYYERVTREIELTRVSAEYKHRLENGDKVKVDLYRAGIVIEGRELVDVPNGDWLCKKAIEVREEIRLCQLV